MMKKRSMSNSVLPFECPQQNILEYMSFNFDFRWEEHRKQRAVL